MKKTFYLLLLFYLPYLGYGQTKCDTLNAILPCDTVNKALNTDLGTYFIPDSGNTYSIPFATTYLSIRYSNYNLYPYGRADVLGCCSPSSVNTSDSSFSHCDSAEVLFFGMMYNLPQTDSCMPAWLYNAMLPNLAFSNGDTTINMLCSDLAKCNFTCLNLCRDTLRGSCDSIRSYAYVYRQLLHAEGLSVDTTLLDNCYAFLYGHFLPYASIMTEINNCNPNDTAVLTKIVYSAKNVNYSDSAGQYFLDFDVFASDTPVNLLFAQSNIFIQYDSTIFGTNLVSSGKITASKGMAVDSPYYNLSLTDSTSTMLKIAITHTPSPASLTNLDSVNQQLCHLRVNVTGFSTTSVAAYFDTLSMAGHSEYQQTPSGIEFPYDKILVSGLRSPGFQDLVLDIESVVLSGSPLPTYLDFDVNGFSQVNTLISNAYLVDYSITLFFDPNTFDSVSFINYLSLGDDASSPGGTGPGTNGGNCIYGFNGTVSGDTIVIALTDSGNFDPNNGLQDFDYMDIAPLVHVRLHIANCGNIPNVYIDPSSSSSHWWDATSQHNAQYTPIDTDQASYGNNGQPMCILPPKIYSWTPTCTNAGSFEVMTITGQSFGSTSGTVYFNNASNPGTFFPTYPQDIVSWSDNQIQLLIPSQPYAGQIAGSGQFFVKTSTGLSDSTDNEQISIGYANLNLRSGGYPLFVYYPDSTFTFQMDSALFFNPSAVTTIGNVLSDINCRSGLFFHLNTTTPAVIDSPIANDGIHLICLKPSSSYSFPTGALAVTLLKDRIEPCSNGLSAYNNIAGYLTDVDMVINSDISWNWSQDTLPSLTQDDFGTSMLHEFGHAAGLCHTLPSSSGNVMFSGQSLQEQILNYANDPDDILGIINMLSVGHTIGLSSGGCVPGKPSFYVCVSHETPSGCVTRVATTNGIPEIEDIPNGFSASLYPNPYEGTTVIHIDASEYTEFSIAVYDILGRVVRQVSVAGSGSFDVPLSGFNESAGMYLIAVSDSHIRLVLKMIKQ